MIIDDLEECWYADGVDGSFYIPSRMFVKLFLTVFSFSLPPKSPAVANLQTRGGSKALVIAAIWTGIAHLGLGVLGTFVLKRFPTSFSIGFLLGVLIVMANQNLILFGTFHGYGYGNPTTNHAFANVGLTLFLLLSFFSVLLYHFKTSVVLAPEAGSNKRGESPTEEYQQYNEGA